MEMGKAKEAAYEYGLFLKRKLPTDHPLRKRRRSIQFSMGKALIAAGEPKEARAILDAALTMEGSGKPSDADILIQRGLAGQKAGTKGYRNDWEAAADKGSKRAMKLLAK